MTDYVCITKHNMYVYVLHRIPNIFAKIRLLGPST